MSKWISDAYIKRLLQNNRLLQGNCEYKLWEQEVEKTVDVMPSIDIVRCGECNYWEESQYYQEFMVCTYVKGATFTRQHDDFCSRGERKESE